MAQYRAQHKQDKGRQGEESLWQVFRRSYWEGVRQFWLPLAVTWCWFGNRCQSLITAARERKPHGPDVVGRKMH